MKMRKILSFVLVLSLVLGSFSMAFAATPSAGLSDIDGIANEQAIEVAYNLGIVTGNPDGTYLPEKAVTRAEFAALITRALAIPESALAGYTATSFKDTTGYGWAVPYLAFCQSKGIMLGDGQGNAMPGRTINTNEAVTMALRAVGYTAHSAKLVGTWPANYVTLAQAEGLYKDVSATANVDKANAAQIIYNLLTVELVQVASDGTTTTVMVNGSTTDLLASSHDAVRGHEVVAFEADALINTLPYVGDWAVVYRDGETDKIIAIGDIDSVALTGEFKSVAHASSMAALSASEFKADGVTYTVADSYTYYGAQFTNANDGSFTYNTTDTVTLNVKLQGKKIVAIYSVEAWVESPYQKVDAGDLEDIADGKLLGKEFDTDKDDKIIDTSFELVGVKNLSDIKAGNVVYVYADSDTIRKVAVGTEIVEGTVQSFKADDEFKIAGKVYANAKNADKKIIIGDVASEVKVWLDAYGDVFTFEVTKGQANNYAVVTGEMQDNGNYDTIVRLMTADGNGKVFTVDSDAIKSQTAVAGQLVAYSLDKDGVIDGLKAVSQTAVNTIVTDKAVTFDAGNVYLLNTRTVVYTSGAATATAVVNTDVVVFTYKGALTDNDYDVTTIAKVETGASKNLRGTSSAALYFDKDGKVAAMLIVSDMAEATDTDVYGVINDSVYTANADGDKVWQLIGFADGAAFDKLTSSSSKNADASYGTQIQLYRLGTNADGVFNKVELVTTVDGGMAAVGTPTTSAGGVVVGSAGTGFIKATNGGIVYPVADNASYYQVEYKANGTDIDKYSKLSGSVKENNKVWLFDTDKDTAGYDVVIVLK